MECTLSLGIMSRCCSVNLRTQVAAASAASPSSCLIRAFYVLIRLSTWVASGAVSAEVLWGWCMRQPRKQAPRAAPNISDVLASSRRCRSRNMWDFNVTEDAIDRMLPKLDNESAITALREVRHEWNMRDVWCWANPTEIAFTYRAQTRGEWLQVRLDRIYVSKRAEPLTFDWEIKETAILTDHAMVSVRFAPKDTPQIGRGRWTLPLSLLNNEKLLEKIAEHSNAFLSNTMRDQFERTDQRIANVQTHWESYKNSIHKITKEVAKECYYKITSRIKTIEKDLRDTNNNQDISTNKEVRSHEAYLANHLKHLKKKEARNRKDLLSAKLANHGEHLGGMWSALGKEKRPRNPVHRLKIPNSDPLQYVTFLACRNIFFFFVT